MAFGGDQGWILYMFWEWDLNVELEKDGCEKKMDRWKYGQYV